MYYIFYYLIYYIITYMYVHYNLLTLNEKIFNFHIFTREELKRKYIKVNSIADKLLLNSK